ncbi:MAG: mechanosensitive ion channel family protein [Anaerolineae bacterium]
MARHRFSFLTVLCTCRPQPRPDQWYEGIPPRWGGGPTVFVAPRHCEVRARRVQRSIGDRVRIGNVTGDVLDVSMLRTTVMEIGEWVKAEQYTGRVVTIANRSVFSDPVFNYTQHWAYLWDEITIPISYESDWRRAREIMLDHAEEYTAHLQADAQAELQAFMKRYPVRETSVAPRLYTVMTDNWIELTLRHVVEARERRKVTGNLHQELLQHFEQEPTITVASATFDIVGFPPLKGDLRIPDKVEPETARAKR